MSAVATLAAHAGLGLALVAPWIAARRAGPPDGRRWAVTLLALAVAVLLLQAAIDRPRPEGLDYRVLGIAFPSFPSGHAAIAFASATYVLLLRPRWPMAIGLLMAAAVAACRVVAGAHFLTDVIAGGALGIGFAITGYGFRRWPEARPAWAWFGFGWMGMVVMMAAWACAGLGGASAMPFVDADKALHFFGFGLVGVFAVGWFAEHPAPRVLAIVVGLTMLDEAMQVFLPSRTVDPLDAIMSGLGVVVFGALGHATMTKRTTAPTEPSLPSSPR